MLLLSSYIYPGIFTNAMSRNGQFPDKWKPVYDVLVGIRNDLDKLSLTQAWSLRETDLYDYQRQLDRIDESRVNGNWVDDQGQPAELYVQRVRFHSSSYKSNFWLTIF